MCALSFSGDPTQCNHYAMRRQRKRHMALLPPLSTYCPTFSIIHSPQNKAGPDLNRPRATTGRSHSYSRSLHSGRLWELEQRRNPCIYTFGIYTLSTAAVLLCQPWPIVYTQAFFLFFFFFASSRNSLAIDTERGGRKGIELGLRLKFLVCVLRQLEASKLLLSIS